MCFEKENKRSLTRVQGYKKRSCQEAGGPNLTREDRVPWPYGGHPGLPSAHAAHYSLQSTVGFVGKNRCEITTRV